MTDSDAVSFDFAAIGNVTIASEDGTVYVVTHDEAYGVTPRGARELAHRLQMHALEAERVYNGESSDDDGCPNE